MSGRRSASVCEDFSRVDAERVGKEQERAALGGVRERGGLDPRRRHRRSRRGGRASAGSATVVASGPRRPTSPTSPRPRAHQRAPRPPTRRSARAGAAGPARSTAMSSRTPTWGAVTKTVARSTASPSSSASWSRTSPTTSPIAWVASGCSDSAAANGIRPDPQTGGSSVMGTTVNGPSPSRQCASTVPYSANSSSARTSR